MPSISAVLETVGAEGARLQSDVQILISPFGIQMKGAEILFGRGGVFLQNFEQEKQWLVDRDHKTYAELPEELPDEELLEEKESGEDFSANFESGILATKPCLGNFFSEKTLLKEIEDHGLEVWQCQSAGLKIKQYFNREYGLVVKEVMPDVNANLKLTHFIAKTAEVKLTHPLNLPSLAVA